MTLTNDFTYSRKYLIRDLPRPNIIFNKCEQLEFDTFESFIKNYLLKENMILQTNFKKLIVPIIEPGQISKLKGVEKNKPAFLFYLKKIDSDILSEITDENMTISNFGIMIDGKDIDLFKQTFESLSDKVKQKVSERLARTHGAFRHILNKDNVGSLITDTSLPYLTFPFFNFCDLIIQYHTFENTELKDLHSIIYQFKFIFKNYLHSEMNKTINWKFYNERLQETEYRFHFMQRNGSELYISENNVRIYPEKTDLSEFPVDLMNSDGNYMSPNSLDRFLGAVALEYDCNSFISKYENYLCNGNLTSLPYLNRIIDNIMLKGDI